MRPRMRNTPRARRWPGMQRRADCLVLSGRGTRGLPAEARPAWWPLHGGLLLGGAVDAAATLGQVVDSELDDLVVRVEAANHVAGRGVRKRVAELGDQDGAVAHVPVDVDVDEQPGVLVWRDRLR